MLSVINLLKYTQTDAIEERSKGCKIYIASHRMLQHLLLQIPFQSISIEKVIQHTLAADGKLKAATFLPPLFPLQAFYDRKDDRDALQRIQAWCKKKAFILYIPPPQHGALFRTNGLVAFLWLAETFELNLLVIWRQGPKCPGFFQGAFTMRPPAPNENSDVLVYSLREDSDRVLRTVRQHKHCMGVFTWQTFTEVMLKMLQGQIQKAVNDSAVNGPDCDISEETQRKLWSRINADHQIQNRGQAYIQAWRAKWPESPLITIHLRGKDLMSLAHAKTKGASDTEWIWIERELVQALREHFRKQHALVLCCSDDPKLLLSIQKFF